VNDELKRIRKEASLD